MSRYFPSVSESGARWLRLVALLIGMVLLGWAILDLRSVLTPILTALAIAYVLHPVISWLERRGLPRLWGLIGLYAVGTALLLALGIFVTLQTIEQAVALRENMDRYVQTTREWLDAVTTRTAPPGSAAPAGATEGEWWKTVAPLVRDHAVSVANATIAALAAFFGNVLNWLSIFVLIPVFTFFFLWRFDALLGTVRDHLPAQSRPMIVHVVTTIDRAMAGFFRGRLIACLIVGLATGIGWTLAGVSYGLPLGALAGVLNLVPFLSLLMLPPALVSSYFGAVEAGADWKLPVMLAMGVFLAVQALDSFVLTPAVQARACGLHPLTTVVALMIGAHWAGLLGMLLAVPLASTLKVLGGEMLMPELRRLAGHPSPQVEAEPRTAEGAASPTAEDGPSGPEAPKP